MVGLHSLLKDNKRKSVYILIEWPGEVMNDSLKIRTA